MKKISEMSQSASAFSSYLEEPLSSSASSSEEEDLVENDDAVEEQKNDEGDSNGTKGAYKPEDINLDNVGDEKPLSKSQEESFALIQDFYDKRIKSDD